MLISPIKDGHKTNTFVTTYISTASHVIFHSVTLKSVCVLQNKIHSSIWKNRFLPSKALIKLRATLCTYMYIPCKTYIEQGGLCVHKHIQDPSKCNLAFSKFIHIFPSHSHAYYVTEHRWANIALNK